MRIQTVTLDRDTPARMLGLKVTVSRGERLQVAPPVNDVCTCWTLDAKRGGPAALVPITIGAEYLPLRENTA